MATHAMDPKPEYIEKLRHLVSTGALSPALADVLLAHARGEMQQPCLLCGATGGLPGGFRRGEVAMLITVCATCKELPDCEAHVERAVLAAHAVRHKAKYN